MKKLLAITVLLLTLCSCEFEKSLYRWNTYEESFYENYKTKSAKSLDRLMTDYEYLVNHPGGSRGTIAPGICAEYGYLLLAPENPKSDPKKGLKLLQKEIELYPESAVFLGPIIKKFNSQQP